MTDKVTIRQLAKITGLTEKTISENVKRLLANGL